MKTPREASGPGYRLVEERVESAVSWQLVSGPRIAQRWWVGPRYSRYGLMGYGPPRGDATTCVSHGWIYDLPTNRYRAGQCGSRGWSVGYTRHVGTSFGGSKGRWGLAMVPFNGVMVVSYRLSIVTRHCPISNYAAEICHWMSLTIKSTGDGSLWGKIWRGRGWPMYAKFYQLSGRDMGLSYAKEIKHTISIFWRLSTMRERDRQTDRPRNGNIDSNKRNRCSSDLA